MWPHWKTVFGIYLTELLSFWCICVQGTHVPQSTRRRHRTVTLGAGPHPSLLPMRFHRPTRCEALSCFCLLSGPKGAGLQMHPTASSSAWVPAQVRYPVSSTLGSEILAA